MIPILITMDWTMEMNSRPILIPLIQILMAMDQPMEMKSKNKPIPLIPILMETEPLTDLINFHSIQGKVETEMEMELVIKKTQMTTMMV